jgi:hypothetical protein
LLYLPAYSPDLNSIGHYWAWFKSICSGRNSRHRTFSHDQILFYAQNVVELEIFENLHYAGVCKTKVGHNCTSLFFGKTWREPLKRVSPILFWSIWFFCFG